MVDNLSYLSGGTVSIDQPDQGQVLAPIQDPNLYPKIPLPWNEETAQAMANRAAKAAMGLSAKTGITEDEFRTGLQQGKEPDLRNEAASKVDVNRFNPDSINRASTITDPNQIRQMFQLENPDTVFEKHYAQEYMSHLDWPKKENTFNQDVDLYHNMTAGLESEYDYVTKALGNPYLAFKEYVNTKRENGAYGIGVGAMFNNAIRDIAELFTYSEAALRKAGIAEPGILMGTNLQEQSSRLFNIAMTDFNRAKEIFDTNYDSLHRFDPVLADRWAAGISGQSQNDRQLNNFFTAAIILGPLGSIAKPFRSVAGTARMSAAQRASTFDRLVSATTDMIRTPDPSIPPTVAAPAMAGNVPESAIRKITIDNINQFAGRNDPVREWKERLTSNYDMDATAAASDPGRLGREMANRIQDVIAADRDRFVGRIFDAARINKMPGATEIEANTRTIQQVLVDRHRGIDNSVLDISNPIYVPASNTFMYNIAIGTHDADLFHNYEEMQDVARRNGLIEKGSIIETPKYLAKRRQLEGAIKGIENVIINTARPRTFEDEIARLENESGLVGPPNKTVSKSMHVGDRLPGVVEPAIDTGSGQNVFLNERAANSIDLIRQRIKALEDSMPRYETGVTFERHIAEHTEEELRMESEGGIEPRRQGHGWYINKIVYLPFDEPFVQNTFMTKLVNNRGEFRAIKKAEEVSTRYPFIDWSMTGERWWSGWAKAIFGRVASPIGRLSITENQMRQIATGGPSVLTGILRDGSPMKIVPRADRKPFNRYINYLQKTTNPDTGLPGIWDKTPQQMETWWQTNIGRSPHPNTEEAYFRYKDLLIDDLNMRDLYVGQRKRERGIELHNLKWGNNNESGFFEAARLWQLPSDNKNVMFFDSNGKNRRLATRFIQGKVRDSLQRYIDEGRAKLVEVAEPRNRPFKDITDRRIDYALAFGPQHEERPLTVGGHVNRLGGGHLMPEYPWFHKQAHVDEGVYEGDKTILNFLTKAQADEALPYMENFRKAALKYKKDARILGQEADREALMRFEEEGGPVVRDIIDDLVEANRRTGIPFWKHYDAYFGKNAFLSLNEPIHTVEINKKIIHYPEGLKGLAERHPGLIDGTKAGQGSLMSRVLPEFTQERDAEGLWTLRNKGTQQNPLFAYEPAPYLDPLIALDRGYNNIARSLWVEDLKDYSIAHFLEQAHPYLNTGSTNTLRDVRNNPFEHFYKPDYLPGTPKQIQYQLEANRKQALDFWSHPTVVDNLIRSAGQQLANSIYKTTGGKDAVSIKLMRDLPKMRNPIAFFRNMAFHPVMGFLAWPTFLMQMSTFSNVFAISPRSAAGAAFGALMHGIMRFNKSAPIVNAMDKMASSLMLPGMRRYKSGELLEATRLLESTGFLNSEHAFASNTQKGIFRSGISKVIDLGLVPFKAGVNFVRRAAWFASYLEYREANPLAIIGQKEIRLIQDRARLLDHNMTSAMSTKAHTGFMSIPLQFNAYDLRVAEMMYGPELTNAEKARMFTTSLALFGAGAGGLAYYGLPLARIMMQRVEDWMGYVPGDSVGWDMLMQGGLSVAAKYLTGQGDYTKGHLYNFSRFGNKNDALGELITGDRTPFEIMTNVVGQQWFNMFKNSFELRHALGSLFPGQDYPITDEEIADMFNSIREVANVRELWAALQTGKYVLANGVPVGDTTKANAYLRYFTGLAEVQNATIWDKQQEVRNQEEDILKTEALVAKHMRRAMQNLLDNDKDGGNKEFRMARNLIEVFITNPQKQTEAWNKAVRNFGEDMKDRVNKQLYQNLMGDLDMLQRIYREEGQRK